MGDVYMHFDRSVQVLLAMATDYSQRIAVKYGLGRHIGTLRPEDLAIEAQVCWISLPTCRCLIWSP